MNDFETTRYLSTNELKALERDLCRLDDCDLDDWDFEFIEDLSNRVIKYGKRVVITGRQWEQFERIKGEHL